VTVRRYIPHAIGMLITGLVLLSLPSCNVDTPTMANIEAIKDSRLFDRRIKESPRQKVVRECQQETDRFRVNCVFCHTTDKIADIKTPDELKLTKVGDRAQIMRKSPSFGLNQDCTSCHQSKFHLTRAAEKLFSPGGAKFAEAQKELKPDKN